jgi:hypothetical protein
VGGGGKKYGGLSLTSIGFFFVAECDEISNLRLVEGIYKIVEFIDSEIAMKDPLLFLHW